ncbi:hypothetical protein MNBD_GAMMA12-642 [hydrothermal vent metagenome]|uniref:CheW-like domain-containing protein n=1 Tax=hydrothermal vent metagenome TaxID=652676 RepID=A0A3B0YIB1_9ZZZZ
MLPLSSESFTQQDYQPSHESRRHGFYIANLGLLIPTALTCELTEKFQICKIANTPDWFAGMTNLRGNIAPIFDLATLFGIAVQKKQSKGNSLTRKLLFIKVNNDWAGFYSDGLPTRVILKDSDRINGLDSVPRRLKPFITHCYQQKVIWLDCDIENLLIWIRAQFE